MALENIVGMLGNLTPAQRVKVIATLDRIYREHYSIVQMPEDARVRMSKRLEYLRGEISEEEAAKALGSFYSAMKELKEKYVRAGILTADRAVVNHLYNVIRGAIKTTYRDSIAREQEIEAVLYELNEACRTILHDEGNTTGFKTMPAKEDVFEAVAKSYTGYWQKGLRVQEAIQKAIAENKDDVYTLGLWRTNGGRPDQGEPGSSWKACYHALYAKGYIQKH
jgi:hypothetical protein